MSSETIRMRGTVQGVGFRPTVARVARRLGLAGWVKNDADGVLVALSGPREVRDSFVAAFLAELPPLARVESVERTETGDLDPGESRVAVGAGFAIVESGSGSPHTAVAPDAATCAACLAEVRDPAARRYRYPFTNCTHCGPRFTIVTGIPYDRQRTTMAPFELCAACRAEYTDDGDRRYHAEPIACPRCGPRVSLEPERAAALIREGAIVAVKGLGGYHLCCDATSEAAVAALRERKRRRGKPFALMMRDLEAIERLCVVGPLERQALTSSAAPIVLLERRSEDEGGRSIASGVAPGQRTLGGMLPATPLHHLLMERLDAPIVCTSGNLSEEPQCVDAAEARERLGGIADFFLDHDRAIAQRIDDSVVRLADGEIRVIRRARGFTPAPLALPPGFEGAPRVTAMGAQLKGTVCLLQEGHAVLSQHLGDLDDRRTFEEQRRTLRVLSELYEHAPEVVAVDMHPDYPSTREGVRLAEERGLPIASVQHHHAHIAACLAEHRVPLDAPPVLGIALDGLGYGADGGLWGGEFLMGSYAEVERVASFRAVALLGGDVASREPWRNLYAYLRTCLTRQQTTAQCAGLPLHKTLLSKPLSLLDQALRTGIGAPLASSCGRLFDAVAAAVGLHAESVEYEGQAAIALEQAATPAALRVAEDGPMYPVMVHPVPLAPPGGEGANRGGGALPIIDPSTLFPALLRDLAGGTSTAIVAARFHVALADAVVRMALAILTGRAVPPSAAQPTVALGGGVWQNRVLLELVAARLRGAGVRVLVPREVPANDGGVALGQAVVAAARFLVRE